jgi:hypothetical protein
MSDALKHVPLVAAQAGIQDQVAFTASVEQLKGWSEILLDQRLLRKPIDIDQVLAK